MWQKPFEKKYSNLLTLFPEEIIQKSVGKIPTCTTMFIITFIKLKII